MATLHARSAKWLNLAPALATQPVSRDQGYQAMSGVCQDIRHLETSDTHSLVRKPWTYALDNCQMLGSYRWGK